MIDFPDYLDLNVHILIYFNKTDKLQRNTIKSLQPNENCQGWDWWCSYKNHKKKRQMSSH